MDNQPVVDRSVFFPLLIGGMSVVGIFIILLIGRSLNSPAQIAVTESATPFQFVYLGTEPVIATPLVEGSVLPVTEEPIEEPGEEEPIEPPPVLVTPTRPAASTPILATQPSPVSTPTASILRTNTPTRLVTSTQSSPAAANTYDDTDSRLTYTGDWIPQTNVSGAYQNTLHLSDVADDKSVQFTFTGQEIRFYYQAAPGFGTVTIFLDNEPLGITVNQAQGGEWVYVLDEATSHTIEIAHTGGGSVNIDRFVIPALTPTPSRTPTPTP